MSIDAASVDPNDEGGINAAFKKFTAVAEGQGSPGIVPKLFNTDDLEEISKLLDGAKLKYKDSPTNGNFAKLAYCAAAERDVSYLMAGRKYMTVIGLTKKCMSLSLRSALLHNCR